MARGRSVFRNVGGVRRQVRETLWLEVGTGETLLAGAPSVAITNSLNAAALALTPFTVIRVRGVLHCRSDQNVASETTGVSIGYAVVSEQAVAIGVTAVPTPVTEKGSDLWFVHETVFMRYQFGSNIGFDGDAGIFMKYDSKAMRKVEDGSDLVVVVENEINGCTITTSSRILIKLH